ncbi:MAG: transporter associated domain-containing protein, partial [Bacillus sp. (in: firmicutes)]
RKVKENHYLFSSRVLIDEVNDLLGIHISEEDVDTIGGWFMTKNIDAQIGDEIEEEGYVFKIIEIDEYHIAYLEVMKIDQDEKPD